MQNLADKAKKISLHKKTKNKTKTDALLYCTSNLA